MSVNLNGPNRSSPSDQDGPPIAEDLSSLGHWAVLPIGAHARMVHPIALWRSSFFELARSHRVG
jgi:hypothetical protein